jgi:transcriptional regulator with XRE-family HTH domain
MVLLATITIYHIVVDIALHCGIIILVLKKILDNWTWRICVEKYEFIKIRQILKKSQKQLAGILCVSSKAVQSYEQGWRKIPAYIEKQMLMLLVLKKSADSTQGPCWKTKDCPGSWRQNCIVWELKAKNFCWFLNGSFCQGKVHKNWEEKIKFCRDCSVYKSMFSDIASIEIKI